MAVPGRKYERHLSDCSADSLKTLNDDLRDHLSQLRSQLEHRRGSFKQDHWQRVLDIRTIREQEQKKHASTILELRNKLQNEKRRELENLKEQLQHKHDQELQKVTRLKDMDVTKLKHELEQKESLLHRLISEGRRDSLKLSKDGKKFKLLNELSDLRNTKKQLEESLTYASEAERQYCRELRKTAEHYQAEVMRVKREARIDIRHMIEQLKNKDKIISHLERELGHKSGYALQLALDRETSGGAYDASPLPAPLTTVTRDMDLSHSHSSGSNGKHGDGNRLKCDTYLLTYEGEGKRAIEDIAHLETEIHELQEKCDCLIQDNQDLSKKLKDIEQKNRQLNEKNKKFLDKNVELTSLNRNFQDQTQLLTEEHKKLKEQHEHSRRKCQQVVKQLQLERCEKVGLEEQLAQMDGIKQQLTDQGKTIASLKQSCSEKDRRIELIQHRKKRRRLMRSQEKCAGVKETFYGYDEDSRSENSENSLSSVSFGTISDEELWDEISREEVEKNYQRLMKEHLELQKSFSLLQRQTDGLLDPQRESKMRSQLEMDLFRSQCKIEELEKILRDLGQAEACDWLKQKEQLFTQNEELQQQIQAYENDSQQLQQELSESKEQVEDLEFRILELEECQPKVCECGGREVTAPDSMSAELDPLEVEWLQKQLAVLLEGKGEEGRQVLKRVEKLRDAVKQLRNLECTSKELQAKVISLQQEKTTLEEMMLSTNQGTAPSPNKNETVEVLALKDQLVFHEKSEVELMEKNMKLQHKLDECEKQNNRLLKRIEELEEKNVKFQAKHAKPMNRTDSEKEKLHEQLKSKSISTDAPNKKDKNSQTYTKMLDKSVYFKCEETFKHSAEDFDLLDQKMQTLYEENLSLKRKMEETKMMDDDSERSLDVSYDSRLAELEEYCEELQDRLQSAEMSERQIREKLKLAEHTINEIESSESYYREKVEELTNREAEAKKQTAQLCQTVQELKEIVLDKDVVETTLHEKVDFLEKAELASAQIIQELQNTEKSLRRQLEIKSDIEGDPKFAEKMKNRVIVLERENKKLSVRVSELEEDEEVLRENWRRVADEDANRIQCLEEKVKLLDSMNRQLKNSLQDAQDDVYIQNNVPQSSSLASELSESQKNNGDLTLAKRSFSTPYLYSSGFDVQMPPRSLSQRDLDMMSENDGLEKIQELEEQIENIVEDKNSKIETLHEKIARLRENEVKLTETLMEMENEERELKAKLALYESSAVTVEKMLQYEDKILELHSSQENLLDRLESLEDHEMTLQEKLDMAEQQSKMKVGTLEKQLKNVHAQLEQAKLRTEELTKEKEFLKKQIDKLENKIRLYVRKGEEAKEKITELNGKIQVFEQREAYASEQLKGMEQGMGAIQEKEGKMNTRIVQLENEVKDLREREEKAKSELERMQRELKEFEEKDSHSAAKLVELEKHEKELMEKVAKYRKSDSVSKQTISELENQISDLSSKISLLERELTETRENEKARLVTIENMERTQTELSESLKKMRASENTYVDQISSIEHTKSETISELEKEKRELTDKLKKLEASVREHVGSVKYLEQKLSDSQGCERVSAEKITSLEATLSDFEQGLVEKTTELKVLEKEKADLIEKFQDLDRQADELECENRELKDQTWNLQNEKESLEKYLSGKENVQQEELESLKTSLQQLTKSNEAYETQIQTLSSDVKSYEHSTKDLSSEMDGILSLKCDLEKQVQTLAEEVASLEKSNEDLKNKVARISSEKDEVQSSLDNLTCDVDFLNGVIGDLKFSVKTLEGEKSELSSQCETVQTECFDLKQKLTASKSFDEEADKKVKSMSQDMESLENAKKELLKSVLGLENEKQKISTELEMVNNSCESVKVKLNESCENEKNLRDKLMSSEEEKNNLWERVKSMEEELAEMRDQQQKLHSEQAESKQTVLVLQSSQEKHQELEEEKKSLVKKLEDLQKTNDRMSQKLEVLQDAEGKLMDRVNELEQVELDLREELQRLQKYQSSRDVTDGVEAETLTDVSCHSEMTDQSTSTADLSSASPPETGRRVSGMFQRLQELEIQNKDMSIKVLDHDSATTQVKQLKEKVKLLEQSEDKLMERVMELEESEDRLRGQVDRIRRTSSVDESDGGRTLVGQGASSTESNTSELIVKLEQVVKEKMDIEQQLMDEQESHEKVVKEKGILEEELQHLTETFKEEKQELEEKIKNLERIKQKEQFKVDSLQSSEFVLKKDLENVKTEKKGLEEEVADLKTQMIDFQSQIVDLENEVQEEKHKVESVNDKKISMEEKVRSLEKTLSEEKEKAKRSASNESVLVKSMSEEKKAIRDLEKELRVTQQKLEDIQTEYEEKISTLEKTEKSLKSAMNHHIKKESELDDQIKTLKRDNSEICDKCKQLENRVTHLQTENSSLVQKCDTLSKHNDELNDSVKSLTDEDPQKKSHVLNPVLPKITSTLTSTSRTKDILKKPLPFGANKPVQSFRDKDLHGQIQALESKQFEYLDTISRLEKENARLKENSSKTVTSSLVLTPASKKFGVSRYSGTTESSSEDLLQKVHKLEEENSKERSKVKVAEEQLSSFRAEVSNLKDFITSGEKKTDTFHKKSKSKSLHHMPELSSLEMELRRKVAEIQHREQTLRSEVSPISVEKLKHQVIELEASEAKLKQKVVDLQLTEDDLKKRLREVEQPSQVQVPSVRASRCDGNHGEFFFKIDNLKKSEENLKREIEKLQNEARNNDLARKVSKLEQSEKSLKQKIERLESKQLTSASEETDAMLDKPEDVLMQQIRELEKLDKHHREQISELEADREELHEIARRDKATIHDQNVRIRELQLSEKVLREQVERMEVSENELYQKCEDLESRISKMEDGNHLLQIHERRLRELVKKLKLDEELWIAKSENMEMTVEELAASEANLRKRLEELAMEKMTLAQKSEYLSLRCQELESSETALFEKVKSYENVEVSLQNKLMVLEKSEQAANSKISELDMMNMDISTRLQRAVEENAVLYNHIQSIQGNLQEVNRQLLVVKDSEIGLKQQVESSEKNETVLQKRLKEFELRDIDSQAKVRQLEQTEAIMKDRISTLQRSENKLKYRIQELENSTKQLRDGVSTEKLPRTLEECHKRIIVLQQAAEESAMFSAEEGAIVKVPRSQFADMQAKMVLLEESEQQMSEMRRLISNLQDTLTQLRQGKGSCGHEVELDVSRRRINSYETTMQRLTQILPVEQVPSLLNSETDQGSVQGSSSEILPARGLHILESERVIQTMRGLTGSKGSRSRPPTQYAEDHVPSDLSSVEDETMHQIQGSRVINRPQISTSASRAKVGHLESSDAESVVEEHWKKIESKKPRLDGKSEPSGTWKSVGKALPSTSANKATDSQEEMMIGVTLHSESEHSHYHSQNDTDSNRSSPRLHRATTDSSESHAPPLPKSLPPSLQPKLGSFAQNSYYLPSSDSADESQRFVSTKVIPAEAAQVATTVTRTISVDSVADSGQGTMGTGSMMSRGSVIRDRIAQLERQLQSKSSGAESRTDEEDSVFSWKQKALQPPKNIEIVEKENKMSKEEQPPPATRRRQRITRLEKDLEEKRRRVETFEAWMNTSEELLRNKNKCSDRDIIQNLQTQLVNLRSELQNSTHRRENITEDPAALKTELDKRDREIAAKTNEIETLSTELRQLREECEKTEEMRRNALDSLRCLEIEITELQEAEVQLGELREECSSLRGQLNRLNRVCSDYKIVLAEKEDLDDEIESLRYRLRDLGAKEAENSALEGQLEGASRLLGDRMERVEQLKQELVHLQDKMSDIETENGQLKHMQDDYNAIRTRYEEMERLKNKAMMSMSPLKAQVARLSKKCREKDELIRRLTEALRSCQSAENLSSLLEELQQFEEEHENEEYYRPLSPYTQVTRAGSPRIDVNSFLRNQKNSSRRSSSSSLSDGRDYISDTDLSNSLEIPYKKRPRSADQLERRSPFQGILKRSINANNLSPRGSDHHANTLREKYGNLPDATHFVAITDHIPEAVSSTGRPSLELRLQEGDKVKVTGPLDENGYYEAECNGQLGLVPATCLQPAGSSLNGHHPTPKERRLKHLKNRSPKQDNSPERVTEMYQQLQSPRLSPRHVSSSASGHHPSPTPRHLLSSSTTQTGVQHRANTYRSTPRSGPPDPPRKFHVVRLVGESGILLSWIPPQLDELGNSHNSHVVGYKIYVNGRLCQEPSSPHLAKSVVENIDQDQQQHFAIQTVSSTGQMSSVVDTVYKPTDLPHWGSESEPDSDPDLSAILSSRHYDPDQKRLFLGVYDYNPRHHSPHNYTGYELTFNAGDVIEVFGKLRPDGFYHGEIDGKRGLVPSSFIEEVPSPVQVSAGSVSSLHTPKPPRSGINSLRPSPRS